MYTTGKYKHRYLEIDEGDGPAACSVRTRLQQTAVPLQTADMKAAVGGRRWGKNIGGVEHGFFRDVVGQSDVVQREPPPTRRLVKGVGELQPEAKWEKVNS